MSPLVVNMRAVSVLHIASALLRTISESVFRAAIAETSTHMISTTEQVDEKHLSRKRHGARVWDEGVDVDALALGNAPAPAIAKAEEKEEPSEKEKHNHKAESTCMNLESSEHPPTTPDRLCKSPPPPPISSGIQVYVIERNGKRGLYWDTARRPTRLPSRSQFVNFETLRGPIPPPTHAPLLVFGTRIKQVLVRTPASGSGDSEDWMTTVDPAKTTRLMTLPLLLFPPHVPGVMARRAMLLQKLDRTRYDDFRKRSAGGPGPSPLRQLAASSAQADLLEV